MVASAACAQAQPSLIGTYEGSFENDAVRHPMSGRTMRIYQTVRIDNVDGTRVTGTFAMSVGPCRGEYPLAGAIQDGVLQMSAERRDSCGGYRMRLRHVGDALEGQVGPREMRLTR